jgi:hypothetical protein
MVRNNLGPGGRDQKNKAEEFLKQSKMLAPSMQIQAELEALKARNQMLEDDNKALAAKAAETCGDDLLDAMSDLQLKDFITTNAGSRPLGNPKRATLLRMAMDARPTKAA